MQVGYAHAGTMDWEDPQMLEWYKQKIYHFWGAMVEGGGIEGESFLFYKVFAGRHLSVAKDAFACARRMSDCIPFKCPYSSSQSCIHCLPASVYPSSYARDHASSCALCPKVGPSEYRGRNFRRLLNQVELPRDARGAGASSGSIDSETSIERGGADDIVSQVAEGGCISGSCFDVSWRGSGTSRAVPFFSAQNEGALRGPLAEGGAEAMPKTGTINRKETMDQKEAGPGGYGAGDAAWDARLEQGAETD